MSFVKRSLFHSHLFCPILLMESMCLCSQRRGRKKELRAGKKKKRENREEFAFTASLFKFPPPYPGRKGVKEKRRENKEKEYGE